MKTNKILGKEPTTHGFKHTKKKKRMQSWKFLFFPQHFVFGFSIRKKTAMNIQWNMQTCQLIPQKLNPTKPWNDTRSRIQNPSSPTDSQRKEDIFCCFCWVLECWVQFSGGFLNIIQTQPVAQPIKLGSKQWDYQVFFPFFNIKLFELNTKNSEQSMQIWFEGAFLFNRLQLCNETFQVRRR